MGEDAGIEITCATMADVPSIRTVLAGALSDDPMLTWMFPVRDERRLSRIALFFSRQVERLVAHGLAHRATVGGALVGAALWIPEGTPRDDALPDPRDLMHLLLGEQRNQEVIEDFTRARSGAPSGDGAYLATLGVREDHRGAGIGARLVRAGLESLRCPAWVESTEPRNVLFYERLGFQVVHEAPFAGGTTTMTRLVRDTMAT
ncbi:GNAT family N-acetyltransferase [Brachybacterium sp. ACRRE]|uniref:GNAT family N-acetyltransferase n=1 Tax=Brachybacterium sp. ACRRE TaxID=2918184 RepID=UPI001EF3CC6C|nr:GNAT family N-acetyltransferase [Brachybacterium sp. ACRRE]MCG7310454.1 GNAT family N-acetyltransferase [Brachybacterium sp. ACRRE]